MFCMWLSFVFFFPDPGTRRSPGRRAACAHFHPLASLNQWNAQTVQSGLKVSKMTQVSSPATWHVYRTRSILDKSGEGASRVTRASTEIVRFEDYLSIALEAVSRKDMDGCVLKNSFQCGPVHMRL